MKEDSVDVEKDNFEILEVKKKYWNKKSAFTVNSRFVTVEKIIS